MDPNEEDQVFEEGDEFGSDTDSDPFRDSSSGNASPGPDIDDFPSITLNNGDVVYCSQELQSEVENYKKFFGDKAIFLAFVFIPFINLLFYFFSFSFIFVIKQSK